jgi:hypothetical protein
LITALHIADLFEKDKDSQYFFVSELLDKYYSAVKKYEEVEDSDWPVITVKEMRLL